MNERRVLFQESILIIMQFQDVKGFSLLLTSFSFLPHLVQHYLPSNCLSSSLLSYLRIPSSCRYGHHRLNLQLVNYNIPSTRSRGRQVAMDKQVNTLFILTKIISLFSTRRSNSSDQLLYSGQFFDNDRAY